MNTAIYILGPLVLFGLLYFLRVLPFREKKSREPERTAKATLIARKITSGANCTGRSRLGFNHVLTFQLEDGTKLELYAYEEEYGALRENMEGTLTWQGRYFLGLEIPE